ncbi:MAG: sortase B protein-sorting domain-containing protein, partial [Lachnospiraceae bacterium]|nr:sortase B protein-sorting domain-containing protein [Lachnospiraceae bacterium]
ASKTGDESNIVLWIILAVAALAGAGIVLFLTKKKEK